MSQLTPYLFFEGNCREAMEFYKQCLGGELIVNTVGDTPEAAQMPQAAKDKVIHAVLRQGNPPQPILMASDWLSQNKFVAGTNITLSINCAGADEIRTLFESLSAGGKVTQPLADMFWGATYGSFIDKFGIQWMLNYEKPRP